ncbi:MAG: hypothetical protein ACYC3I_21735 [Gemmataceae bacterium]
MHDIRSTGAAVKETSYYPPLANLLKPSANRSSRASAASSPKNNWTNSPSDTDLT